MENEPDLSQQGENPEENTVVYIVAAVIVVAVIVAGVLMWPKNKSQEKITTPVAQVTPTPNKTPITKFVCESQWYNPVIGLPKYYLSAQAADITTSGKIDCTFTLLNGSTVVLTEKMTGIPLVSVPERNGSVAACTTKALENIPKNVGLTMVSLIRNDEGKIASCSGNVTFR